MSKQLFLGVIVVSAMFGWNSRAVCDETKSDPAQQFFSSVRQDQAEDVTLSLKKNPELVSRTGDGEDRFRTVLHVAAQMGHKDIAALLLDNKADVNAGVRDATPLHVAAYAGHKDIVRLLIARGAKVNSKNHDGKTPLQFAIGGGCTEVADLLRQNGGLEGTPFSVPRPRVWIVGYDEANRKAASTEPIGSVDATKIDYLLAKGDWDSLARVGAAAVPRLIETLKDKNQVLAVLAAATLGTIGDERAVRPLLNLLNDVDVRGVLSSPSYEPASAIVYGLAGCGFFPDISTGDFTFQASMGMPPRRSIISPRADNAVLFLLKSHSGYEGGYGGDYLFPEGAEPSRIIVRMGPAAFDPLCKILLHAKESKQQVTMFRAVEVLGRLHDRRAIAVILKAADNSDSEVVTDSTPSGGVLYIS